MHPIFNALTTATLTDDSEFMLKVADILTIYDVLRKPIVDINISKDGPIEKIRVMHNLISSVIEHLIMKTTNQSLYLPW